jgi:hypothetical protein
MTIGRRDANDQTVFPSRRALPFTRCEQNTLHQVTQNLQTPVSGRECEKAKVGGSGRIAAERGDYVEHTVRTIATAARTHPKVTPSAEQGRLHLPCATRENSSPVGGLGLNDLVDYDSPQVGGDEWQLI